ncbi:MAG: hypothetical protein ABJP02_15625 [Parasphingorhabdus sp.]|uniref:hypothetical protein n=1 Tax=Parasphingorhabdus sp. TaxID=2709688 RepID=UPI003296EF24
MTIGALELTIGATILLLLVIWWLWPSHNGPDLTKPPKDMSADNHAAVAHSEPKPKPAIEMMVAPEATTGKVRNESDYSEEELMMRDVRAALHRGKKIDAIARVRQSTGMSLMEASAFVDKIEMPDGHGDNL